MDATTSSPLQRLGDFKIVREIGRGGMGVVYEAWQVSLKRKVALKALSGQLGLTSLAVVRFRREAEAAARRPGNDAQKTTPPASMPKEDKP